MPARIAVLADAVKDAVNAGITPSPGAIRIYAPEYDTAKIRGLMVAVVPASDRESSPSNRDDRTDKGTVYVAVYRKLAGGAGAARTEAANAEIDVVVELAERIYDLFDFQNDYAGYKLRGVNHNPVFIPQYLRTMGVIVSIVALEFELP